MNAAASTSEDEVMACETSPCGHESRVLQHLYIPSILYYHNHWYGLDANSYMTRLPRLLRSPPVLALSPRSGLRQQTKAKISRANYSSDSVGELQRIVSSFPRNTWASYGPQNRTSVVDEGLCGRSFCPTGYTTNHLIMPPQMMP